MDGSNSQPPATPAQNTPIESVEIDLEELDQPGPIGDQVAEPMANLGANVEEEEEKSPGRGRPPGIKNGHGKKRQLKLPPAPKLTLEQKANHLHYFPEIFLGRKPYLWTFNVLKALDRRGSRVALKACNGAGKTSSVILAAILWHMIRFPGGKTVVTAGVYRQIKDVLWPLLETATLGIGGPALWTVTEGHVKYCGPGGLEAAVCIGFTADDPFKAEGHHQQGKDQALLFIIDEAKSVADAIFHAMERCQPSRVLVVSSPGGTSGEFYRIFRDMDPRYDRFTVTAYDCPHITHEWIAQQIATYGEKSSLVQSMIFAEFGEEDGNALILPPSVLQKAVSSPPAKEGHVLYAGVDFAAGGDENVIVVREGNAVKQVIAWRDKDTMSATGRFITEFKRAGLSADNIYADAGGLGIPMCDALREAGWDVHRVNNGEAAFNDDHFGNRAAEMWTQFARMVETGRVVLPKDELMYRQLTTRRLEHNSKGKLVAEPKEKMRKRGIDSPDRADAIVLAFCGMGRSLEQYMEQANGRPTLWEEMMGEEDHQDKPHFAGCHAG